MGLNQYYLSLVHNYYVQYNLILQNLNEYLLSNMNSDSQDSQTIKLRHNQTPINFKNSQAFHNYYYSHPNQSIFYQLQTKSSQNDSQKIAKRESLTHLNSFLQDQTQFQKSVRATNHQLVQINRNLSKACLKIQQLSNRSLSKQKLKINKFQNKEKTHKIKCIHKQVKQNISQKYYQQIQKKVGKFYQPQDDHNRLKSMLQNKENQNCYSNFVYDLKKPEKVQADEQKLKFFQLNDEKQMLYIEMQKNINSKSLFIRSLEDKIQILKQQNLNAQKQFLKKQSKLLHQINQLEEDYQFLQNQCQIYLSQINFLNDKFLKIQKQDSQFNIKKYTDLGTNLIQIIQLCINWANLMQRAKQEELSATAFIVRQELIFKKPFFNNLYSQLSKQFLKKQNKNLINENQSLLLKNSYLQSQTNQKKKNERSLMKCSSIDVLRQSLSINKNEKKLEKYLKKNIYNSKTKCQNKQIINHKLKGKKENAKKQFENYEKVDTVNSNYQSSLRKINSNKQEQKFNSDKYEQNINKNKQQQNLNYDQYQQNFNSDKCEQKQYANNEMSDEVLFQSVKKELFCLQKGINFFNFNYQPSLQQIYRILLIQAREIEQKQLTFQIKEKNK